ncbi:phosphatidate cytidylyltransferase [Pseudodesulfovibrio thermohalotolerans]|uniref:phosphatidate cytidylyltransferase n=1 Tax=Pseudodesulfovibrio thermohalotolerans TaxID=2880651 RepID=UPI0024412EBB|nr:phosphatidate cytidylyltransferase [Pseudodesulfovibrio thermohalotolerans]WFS63749.1 phosphatidate cytidylyltransferase [Pseudodesulfovibrio thermohalotolerans]
MENSPHKQRIATSGVLAILPALALFFQGWVLFAVLALFSVLTLWEFYSMFRPVQSMTAFKSLGAACTFLLMGAYTTDDLRYPAIILAAAFWASAMIFLLRYNKDVAASYRHAAIFLAGLFYIPLNLHFLLHYNRVEILLVLGAAVVSDTAAFYAGTWFGKRKIWPRISPKKSWAGSIGGLCACTAATLAWGLIFGLPDVVWWKWLLLGMALNIAAQFGDFFESALKRSLDIKDSGVILPGHGGLLDRVDSLLLVTPCYGLIAMFQPFFA